MVDVSLAGLVLGLSVASFFLSLFVLVTYLFFRLTKFPSRLIIYFTLCICLTSLVTPFIWIFGDNVAAWDNRICRAQGTMLTFFFVSSLMWWFTMILQVYLSFVVEYKGLKQFEWILHIVCWGVATVSSVFPSVENQYRPLRLWCGLGVNSNQMWEYAFFDILLGVVCFAGALLWIRVVYQLFRGAPSYSLKRSHSFTYPIRLLRQALFVLCFLVVFVFSLFHRIYAHVKPNTYPYSMPYWLLVLHIVSIGSQGILNFFMFGLRKQNALLWAKWGEGTSQRIRTAFGYAPDVPLLDGYSLNI